MPTTPHLSIKKWPGLLDTPLRYVLLWHTPLDRAPHFDLMLEIHPRRKMLDFEAASLHLPPTLPIDWVFHRYARRRYLSYEGDIGKKRGTVERTGRGIYLAKLEKNKLLFDIHTGILAGKHFVFGSKQNLFHWKPNR